MVSLSDIEFDRITGYLKTNYGINLTKKRTLIESRMASTLAEKGFTNFTDYFNAVLQDPSKKEMSLLISKLTTNHTYFLREVEHFNYFTSTILPEFERTNRNHEIRIWSAGCSSGEEPYTLAMVIQDYFGTKKQQWNTKILASDISLKVLDKAKSGIYSAESIQNVPEKWKSKYFTAVDANTVEVKPFIKDEVVYRQINLMDNFTFKNSFDIILCRNVMIYFDTPTKQQLISKFYNNTRPGGYLFIGHAETINRESSQYKYLMPAIYQK
ncbi:CheR family methyltransferase [Acetanaerobacterium elongatum]|uniref:protein-glutamate O-methyltransferase n=1 Tax=Acetanaerobacterium elongatum TaxID=258515 RepID=A0A1G9ZE58_9FIRM|nr:protein-glutamate O-methyltransferase CheR [Acetanaerobacterium elongatum]SDN19251.1 chemotaxis protein methyltransferase CheR [Acetanaerobacterium elongatum]